MINVQFILPPKVIKALAKRIPLTHKNGQHGYFADVSIEEFWNVAYRLVTSGYRIDIKPGATVVLQARKEN